MGHLTTSEKRYIGALLLNLVITGLMLLLRGHTLRIHFIDAFSVAGAISILLGLLSWVSRAGAFNTVGYAFSSLVSGRKDKDLYEYTQRKQEKRSRDRGLFPQLMVTGALFLAISLVLSAL